MSGERFLVTGAMGCIGAWAVRELVAEGRPWWCSTARPTHGARGCCYARGAGPGDVRDRRCGRWDALGTALDEHRIDHVIHLAALQVPFCRADPVGGARVNVVGTVAVFEAMRSRRERMAPLVYAGSVGMFDLRRRRPGDRAPDRRCDRPPGHPVRRLQARQRGAPRQSTGTRAGCPAWASGR
ncbi:MAG: NAD-dependent epimerase/dehydratase family protein [Chloroflexota bacterium]